MDTLVGVNLASQLQQQSGGEKKPCHWILPQLGTEIKIIEETSTSIYPPGSAPDHEDRQGRASQWPGSVGCVGGSAQLPKRID